jgi:hypothetical protein
MTLPKYENVSCFQDIVRKCQKQKKNCFEILALLLRVIVSDDYKF